MFAGLLWDCMNICEYERLSLHMRVCDFFHFQKGIKLNTKLLGQCVGCGGIFRCLSPYTFLTCIYHSVGLRNLPPEKCNMFQLLGWPRKL